MELHNNYYLAGPSEQLKPQQLSRNVFFGPFNVLSRHKFLHDNQIKFFICIGIPTQRLVNLTSNSDDALMINFDSSLNTTSVPVTTDIANYQNHNSLLLRTVIDKILMESSPSFLPQESNRCLTPQPENCVFERPFIDSLQGIYQNGSVFTEDVTGSERFKIFNDLLTVFQMVNPNASTFIFSQNGNDEELTSFLMSQVLVRNTYIKLNESYKFVKSLRPTINDIKDEQTFWLHGLMDFYESIRKNSGNCEQSPGTQKFRKRIDSMDESDIKVGNSGNTVARCKRSKQGH
ncbi:hypothetical protein HG535_0E02530 [Zygotorulaspora mrakii]|uniref:Uncharacterized protein n=1 Tax=Zygotorulaspora mrakii TaxID=42260 RepID=A0A7H9B5D1_ZYGMR|nr:uncharacterized protein HG535_0E02530 [Zygotorulaspora mrakii]QLG73169.1 hypothetical protein HG535_0E02530 [Zygotorulaspora mrakii]